MGAAAGSIRVEHHNCPDKATVGKLLKSIVAQNTAIRPAKNNKPLILYGAGNLGKMARDYLNQIGKSFHYVVDVNPSEHKNDPSWNGISIIGPDDVSELDKNTSLLAICISTIPYTPVYHSLTAQGWKHIVPFYDLTESYQDRHPLGNGWFAGNLNNKDILAIRHVLEQWSDDISRAHHLQFLAWRLLRQEWVFGRTSITTNNRYFIPQILSLLHDHETFLDVGAHHGEVSIKFSEIVQGKFREILAIEPDSYNLTHLRNNFAKAFNHDQKARVRSIDYVISEQFGFCHFIDKLGYASQISTLGKKRVFHSKIDDIGITPTFIKLHIEGNELAALKGSISTLLANRPIIAAAGYHNQLGLWELPKWLMKSLPEYHFLLRLHGWCGTGMVVYAIPKERATENINFM